MGAIAVLNAGSSSVKFSVFLEKDGGLELALRGQAEAIHTAPRFAAKDSGGALAVAGQIKSGGAWGIVLPKGSTLRKPINKLLRLGEKTGILPAMRTEWLVPALGADPQTVPFIPKR